MKSMFDLLSLMNYMFLHWFIEKRFL